ncbi:MAG TPA: hypothetical protein VLF69_05540 [Candidatus Saccharimonadales bacterium]|nr:hypothetical protein [Candidatus Saccharimonadales bacterium]
MTITDAEIALLGVGASLAGGGFVGYFIKHYLDKKQEFFSKNAEHKRSAYSEVISLLLTVLSQEKLGTLPEKEMVKRLNSAYEQCILYASPNVINAFGDFMQYLFRANEKNPADSKTTLVNMTRVFKCMREDIQLSNDGLGDNAERLMRVKLNDYSTSIADLNRSQA